MGHEYDIYEVDGELVGQQYPSDTGPLDILAISKDRKEFLVIELKKGRASDVVVGEIQRYMGFVVGELAEEGESVKVKIEKIQPDTGKISLSHRDTLEQPWATAAPGIESSYSPSSSFRSLTITSISWPSSGAVLNWVNGTTPSN